MAARGLGGFVGIAGERALTGFELRDLVGVDQKNVAAVLHVTAPAGDGRADLRLGSGADLEAERHIVAVGLLGDLSRELGRLEVRGVLGEVGREIGAKRLAQFLSTVRENVEHAVPVAQPPLPRHGVEREAVEFQEVERRIIVHRVARRQRDGEKMLGAVDRHRREVALGIVAARDGRGRRGGRDGFRLTEMFAHAEKCAVLPSERSGRFVHPEKHGLAGERGKEFAQLTALQLGKGHRARRDAEALQDRKCRDDVGGRRSGQIQFHANGNGIARGGGGEIGGKEQAEHGEERSAKHKGEPVRSANRRVGAGAPISPSQSASPTG